MKESLLEDSLRQQLLSEEPWEGLMQLLRQYKTEGGVQKDALCVLERLRSAADNEEEDKVLELMDIVTGFCSPHAAVW